MLAFDRWHNGVYRVGRAMLRDYRFQVNERDAANVVQSLNAPTEVHSLVFSINGSKQKRLD